MRKHLDAPIVRSIQLIVTSRQIHQSSPSLLLNLRENGDLSPSLLERNPLERTLQTSRQPLNMLRSTPLA